MKILFVHRLFDGVSGGIERMAITMINDLVCRGRQVEVVSWDKKGAQSFFPMEKATVWHRLDIGNAQRKASLWQVLRRLRAMRRIVRMSKPDVIIGFQQGAFLSIAVASLGLSVPVIAAERSAPHRFDHLKASNRRWFQFQSLRLARSITVQMESYRSLYPVFLRRRIVSIPNPVSFPARSADPAGLPGVRKRLLCVARLSYQKNQPVLLSAFADVAKTHPSWDLILVGSGEDEISLRSQVTRLGIQNRVVFIGATRDVETCYLDSHLFCLASRWEGFPNALAEAMSYGLPAVGFAGCAGVNELIDPDVTGLLAKGNGSCSSLSESLSKLMGDDHRRTEMGLAGRARIAQYSPDIILQRWDDLFCHLVRQ